MHEQNKAVHPGLQFKLGKYDTSSIQEINSMRINKTFKRSTKYQDGYPLILNIIFMKSRIYLIVFHLHIADTFETKE